MLKNRLAKAAMTECFCDPSTNLPNKLHFELYRKWSLGGSAMLLTGNVMVDRRYLEAPRNVVLEEGINLEPFKTWAAAMKQSTDCAAVVQISHPGRQCKLPSNYLRSRLTV